MAYFDFQAPDYATMQSVISGADVDKGDFVALSEVDGFYAVDAAIGDTATVITECKRVKVVKNAGEAWTPGEALYWDDSDSNVTNVAGSLSLIGYATEAAASAAVVGYMRFNGTLRFAKA